MVDDQPAADVNVGNGDPSIVVEALGLHYRYGVFEAVRGVSLEVRRGELFTLLGTNGAGKTTTLEMLEGQRKLTKGRVRVLGRDPHRHRRAQAGCVGIMFQETAIPADLTAAESLGLWSRLNPHRKRSIDELLERVDLAHRRNVRAGQLSGGERRRLDLAMALAGDPELLFLDEPTAGLDPESRARTWHTVRELLTSGGTVMLTTHYLEEAEALADRVAIMHEGRIAVSGTLAEVLAGRPARISCTLPHNIPMADLPDYGDRLRLADHASGRRLTISTMTLQADLAALLAWAETRGVTLGHLQAVEPSLATVFHEVSQSMSEAVR